MADVRCVTAVRGETYEPSDVSEWGGAAAGRSTLDKKELLFFLNLVSLSLRHQDSFALVDALTAAAATTWLTRPPVL